MPAPTRAVIRLNTERLVTLRLVGVVQPPAVNAVVEPSGALLTRPGQGGVVPGVGLGDRALGWVSDHLEPGATLRHPEPAANAALQVLSCVGNRAVVLDGPAAGAEGLVFGKHGGVLVSFAPAALRRMAPGERVAVEARGVGLAIADEPDIAFHSCSPELAERLLGGRDGEERIVIPVVAELPPEAAGAGIGMTPLQYNLDLQLAAPSIARAAAALRFGDVVALHGQDHRFGRQPRRGWTSVGVIAHGQSVGGGHGLGLVTLLSGPAARFALVRAASARLPRLLPKGSST